MWWCEVWEWRLGEMSLVEARLEVSMKYACPSVEWL